jgi:hypothetical protein
MRKPSKNKPTVKPSKPLNCGFFGINLLLFANKGQIMKPTNEYDALVLALILAINAPTDEKAAQCADMADFIAANMSELDVERAKKQAIKEANHD